MNAPPYPEGFFTWGEDERSDYFAKAAAAYRERNTLEDAPPVLRKVAEADITSPPLSPHDYGAREPLDAPTNQQRPRFRLLAFDDIKPDGGATYLIKGLLPRVCRRLGSAKMWQELLDVRRSHACCAGLGISRASCRSGPSRLLRLGGGAGLPEPHRSFPASEVV
jgi:hypothetical protein